MSLESRKVFIAAMLMAGAGLVIAVSLGDLTGAIICAAFAALVVVYRLLTVYRIRKGVFGSDQEEALELIGRLGRPTSERKGSS